MTTASIQRATAHVHPMPFGAQIERDGVRFRLWSPGDPKPTIAIGEQAPVAMQTAGDGWFEYFAPHAQAGTRYAYVLGDGLRVPDPASRFQPDDVHGASLVVDPREYRWHDGDWRGRPWHETVLYELHVGTFTTEGTYRAAAARLDELVDLGVTAVELMPLSEAPGAFNWGYDGVLPFAPEHRYGAVDDLKAFVDAAHARGLMVFLDVVYNHFGPDGNYLHAYAPSFFTQRHHTPWGAAINVGPGSAIVRDFFIHNALYWLEEYHIDGLRLDAVHAIRDDSETPFLHELAQRARAACGDREIHLVLENDDNDAKLLGDGGYDAQWNDDVHHLLHVLLTGESTSYYRDYVHVPTALLGRALAQGFAYQGERSEHRGGAARGSSSIALPPTAFVNFLQNHDQIGNRALGERIGALASVEAVRAATLVVLMAPSIPLLFMGEEWSASTPFLFFADFDGDLAAAVRDGRRNEFADVPAFADLHARDAIPDPGTAETMCRSILRREELERDRHRTHRAFVRRLLDVRKREIVPRLAGLSDAKAWYACFDRGGVAVSWRLADGSRLSMVANLCGEPASLAGIVTLHGRCIASTGTVGRGHLGPWSVAVYLAT